MLCPYCKQNISPCDTHIKTCESYRQGWLKHIELKKAGKSES